MSTDPARVGPMPSRHFEAAEEQGLGCRGSRRHPLHHPFAVPFKVPFGQLTSGSQCFQISVGSIGTFKKKKNQKKGPNSLKETAAEHAEIYLLQPQRAGLALETSQMVTRHSLF